MTGKLSMRNRGGGVWEQIKAGVVGKRMILGDLSTDVLEPRTATGN